MSYLWTPFPLPESAPIRSWADIHPFFGDTFHLLDGQVAHRGEPLPEISDARVLPGVLQQHPRFCGDLIPISSHGSSLYNLLTSKDWSAIRKPLIQGVNHVCTACGRRQYRYLQAHEIWEYHLPVQGNQAIQRLAEIKILCKDCHAMYHLALARIKNHFEETFQRLMLLHRWDTEKGAVFNSRMHNRAETLNRYHWSLDLSRASLDTLHIDAKWSAHPELPRVLQAPDVYRGGMHYTAIFGKAYVLAGKQVPAIPSPLSVPDDARKRACV